MKWAVAVAIIMLFLIPVSADAVVRNGHTGPTVHTVAPPGNTTYEPVKIVKGGFHGTFSRVIDVKSTYTMRFNGNCFQVLETKWELTFTATYEWGVAIDTGKSWSEGVTRVVTEFCL